MDPGCLLFCRLLVQRVWMVLEPLSFQPDVLVLLRLRRLRCLCSLARTTRPGTPTTSECGGTSLVTTAFAPILLSIWVFLVIGEKPSTAAMAGAVVVMAAVLIRSINAARHQQQEQVITPGSP